MGANSTQAVAITLTLVSMTLLAGALAGGGFLLALGAAVAVGAAVFFFLKCKPWENQE